MVKFAAEFVLSFEGDDADKHEIDFYDVAQALIGFERSLALTTHFILNNEVITQAPALKGAQIRAMPPQAGSWELLAVVLGGIGYLGTRPKDTPLGHLVYSAYDYVVSNVLGFHVDFDKSLGESYDLARKDGADVEIIDEARFDSVIEKIESAVRDMHRPIVKSETARKAIISAGGTRRSEIAHPLTKRTYEHIDVTIQGEVEKKYSGWVSSYNINTFRGRIYLKEHKRPVPFILGDSSRGKADVSKVSRSLAANASDRFSDSGKVTLHAFPRESRTGRLKSLLVVNVS